MYSKAKSCVQWNLTTSQYFSCTSGVRQGENLSPLLFAVFLNDLKAFVSNRVGGLNSLRKEARNTDFDEPEIDALYKMLVLIYADDTVICAESPGELQNALDAMFDYCKKWQLKINSTKTKVMIFSRGKVRKLPAFMYDGKQLDIVFSFQYLGVKFNYNNKFKVAQKQLYDRASRAMFSLLRKVKSLLLPIDVSIELFDRMIAPILLYGAEIWCPQMCELVNKLQLRFYKILLNLSRSTPSHMILGELGQYPLEIQAKSRMLCFWYKLSDPQNRGKLSSLVYEFLLCMYKKNVYKSLYLRCIEDTLNALGFSHFWLHQRNVTRPPLSFF